MSRALQQLLNPVNGENEPTVDGSFVPNGSMNNVAINHTDFLGSGNNCGGEFLNSTMVDPGFNQQSDTTTLGSETEYSLDADLLEWGNTLLLQENIQNNFGWPHPSFASQQISQASSLSPLPDQYGTQSFAQVDDVNTVVCYGMLHSIDIKLVGDMSVIDVRLRAADSIYQRFELSNEQDHIIIRFPENKEKFGYLRSGETKIISQVLSHNVTFEPVALKAVLREVIGRAHRPADAMVKLDINVYGPRQESSRVSDALSRGKLWLQRPDHTREGIIYENPHFLKLKINGGQERTLLPVEHVVGHTAPRRNVREEQLRKLVEEVYQSVDNSRELERVDGGARVTQQLLRHQQEALAFMLERESGHIAKRYRLWREVPLEGKVQYQHKITKARRLIRPEESGGGILADEMGMGKSLSILALAMKTLDDGQEWADELNIGPVGKRSIKHSRSTLIVVSSGCKIHGLSTPLLITNWETEIRSHLREDLKVIVYHGRRREKDVDKIQDSDIVLTTYSTLAVEYQRKKVEPSILHHIGWYRVVLDEAHIIRRPSGTFYHSCSELSAHSRWCLTGTPIQNKLADIGTLFSFIRAEPFNKAATFRKWIDIAFEHNADDPKQVKDRLVLLLEAFCLRRTKDVLELPNLRQDIRWLDLSPEERTQYDSTQRILMRSIKQRVGETEKGSKFGLFQANLQLRILCNHGTFQKPFSWQRRIYQDEREAKGCALGRDEEIKCSVCQQPMPIVGSSWLGDMFEDRCSHVLCSECIVESTIPGSGLQMRRCPVCVEWRRPQTVQGISSGANTSGESGDLEMTDAPVRRTSIHDDHDYYFSSQGHSTKMKKLVEDVGRNLWETKSIIFSCWTRTLHLVSRHLRDAKIPFLCIDGNCPLQKRQENLEMFEKSNEKPVLIMTTGTGAFGLNLTCANRIFIVELQWNPSVEYQAIARAIRFGQKNEVQVMRYIIRHTVEEEMRKLQQWKKQLATFGFEEPVDEMDVEVQQP
uniref:RING-type domain-containing protein n=1 Tax=Bionectria ochroleuca TaxID=29856 RepID=A0A0B7KCA3_BIOOC